MHFKGTVMAEQSSIAWANCVDCVWSSKALPGTLCVRLRGDPDWLLQEATLIPHPTTVHVVSDLRRKDLLAMAEHERLASAVDGWPIFGLCALALRRLPTGAPPAYGRCWSRPSRSCSLGVCAGMRPRPVRTGNDPAVLYPNPRPCSHKRVRFDSVFSQTSITLGRPRDPVPWRLHDRAQHNDAQPARHPDQ